MPSYKQPACLRDAAMDAMVTFHINFCVDCGTDEGSAEKVRRGIPYIRKEADADGPGIPVTLRQEIYNRWIRKYSAMSPSYATCAIRNGMQLMMDDTIIGLECTCRILNLLRPEDFDRIRGISTLLLASELTHGLKSVHLENLTTIIYRSYCTDSDLEVMREKCPQLMHVDVEESPEVSDMGLLALASCPTLQYFSVGICSKISGKGARDFLSVNKTIRELRAWPNKTAPGFDIRQIPDWHEDPAVYPSIESFMMEADFSDSDARSVIARFPNLKSIELSSGFRKDFKILMSLKKLSRILFSWCTDSAWDEVEAILKFFGPQMRSLRLYWENIATARRHLNVILRLCENLEYLHVHCRSGGTEVNLVVPPFPKLKYFKFSGENLTTEKVTLEFGRMLMLETFDTGPAVALKESQIQSLIHDHINFPRLKQIGLHQLPVRAIFDYYKDLRKNNLDLRIIDYSNSMRRRCVYRF